MLLAHRNILIDVIPKLLPDRLDFYQFLKAIAKGAVLNDVPEKASYNQAATFIIDRAVEGRWIRLLSAKLLQRFPGRSDLTEVDDGLRAEDVMPRTKEPFDEVLLEGDRAHVNRRPLESVAYPWERPEARALHRALWSAVPQPGRIERLYHGFGPDLPALAQGRSADEIWKQALDALAAAGRLKEFCELVLHDQAFAAIHESVRAVLDAKLKSDETEFSDSTGKTTDQGNSPSLEEPGASGGKNGASQPSGKPPGRLDVTGGAPGTEMPLSMTVTERLFESLTRLRLERPTNVDQSFVAERFSRRVTITPPDAHLETVETLRNVTTSNRTEVVRIVVSDAPTEFKRLKVTADIEIPGQASFRAHVKAHASADGRAFRITVSFKGRVVQPSDTVTIRWQCIVPASVMLNDDYWVFPHLFKGPARHKTLEVVFEQDPADVHLFLDQYDESLGRENLKPIPLTISRAERGGTDTPLVVYSVDLEQDTGTYLFTWSLSGES